ncbi:MAG: 16S rRNA (cytosine(1402)-N(4))-methyltransferase RsmH [Planctomycetes bacterium]|nr:16S rRNA (cytosine(1402)-N(4))-methyltransferase RsmH [Planctomycetota bacterium]
MVREVLDLLRAAEGGLLLDGTVGLGGHAAAWLAAAEGARVLGLDRDGEMAERAAANLAPFAPRFRVVQGTFAEARRILRECEESRADAALLDLGANSVHFDDPARGFSFAGGPLDARFDRGAGETLAALLARIPEEELADALFLLGGERHSRRIARALCAERRRAPLRDAARLADVVARASGGRRGSRIHPATRTFQALRMLVNDEMGHLERGLPEVVGCIRPGGRLAVLSFHSGEDGRVKRFFREGARAGRFRLLTRKPLLAGEDEVARNPRSRSARLRAVEVAEGVEA